MLLNKKYNKKLLYSSIISIIIHITIGALLYTTIIKKEKNTNIIKNTQPINTIIPVDTNLFQKKQHQDSLSTKRIKITDTHHQTGEQIPSKTIPKKQHQDSLSTKRIKITDTHHQTGEQIPSKTIPKKQHQDSNVNTTNKNYDPVNHLSHNKDNQLKNLLNKLINTQNIVKNDTKSTSKTIIQKNNNYIRANEINTYKIMISKSIQNKFYDASHYIGKQCNLYMQLNPDGTLLSITAISGDPMLCKTAIIAAKSAHFPKPPNIHIYKIFKNIKLNFSPQ